MRCHEDAQPEFQAVARQMQELYNSNVPISLSPGEYHLPFILESEKELYEIETLLKVSSARCARVSYLLPEGGFSTINRDLELFNKLNSYPLHGSAFEHDAIALPVRQREANLVGWRSYRREFANEANGDYDLGIKTTFSK